MQLVWGNLTIPAAGTLNRTAAPADARQIAVAGSRSVVPLTYGEDRLGALVLNVLLADSTTLLVQCLWGFAGDGVSAVRLNDEALPAGSTVTHYAGAQVTADAALVAAFALQGITYTDALTGYQYSVVKMPVRAFDGQLDITALVRGRKVYDRRKDSTAGGSGTHRLATPSTWEWSDNPALAEADFLASTLYGLGRTVDWASVPASADACDYLVGSPAEKRRTLGVSFITAANGNDVAETLRGYAGCFLLQGPAGIVLLPDADAASVASYSHAAGTIAAIGELVKRDVGNSPTAVEIIYTDTNQVPWRDASVTAQLAGAGSTLPWRLSQVRMPGVKRYSQANREAIERLNKLTLNDLSFPLDVFDVGMRHQRGDIVDVTHPLGLVAKAMRVGDVELLAPGRWRLQLTEHDAAAYSAVVASGPTTPDTVRTLSSRQLGNLVDSGNWVLGSSGDQLGDGLTQWLARATSSGGSNTIVLGTGPDGAQRPIWRAISGSAVGTSPEGGVGNTSAVPIDPSRPYRVAWWVYLSGPTDGSVYMGVGPSEVDDVPAGTVNTNPYFHAFSRVSFVVGRWYLFTGYVLPAGYAGAQLNQSAVYDGTTGQLVATGTDFRWHAGQQSVTLRALQFATTGTGRNLLLTLPFVHAIDGSEPSIATLLSDAVRAAAAAAALTATWAGVSGVDVTTGQLHAGAVTTEHSATDAGPTNGTYECPVTFTPAFDCNAEVSIEGTVNCINTSGSTKRMKAIYSINGVDNGTFAGFGGESRFKQGDITNGDSIAEAFQLFKTFPLLAGHSYTIGLYCANHISATAAADWTNLRTTVVERKR